MKDKDLQFRIDTEISKIVNGVGFVAPEAVRTWLTDKLRTLTSHIVKWKDEADGASDFEPSFPLRVYHASCGPVSFLVAAVDLRQAWAVFTKAVQEGGIEEEDFEEERVIIWVLPKSDWAKTTIQDEGGGSETVEQSMEKMTNPGILGQSDF